MTEEEILYGNSRPSVGYIFKETREEIKKKAWEEPKLYSYYHIK
jgi:hypothetical protein